MPFIFLIKRRPPRSTHTDTLFPYTTLFRSSRYLANHIDVRSATAKTLVMEKMPAFKPVPDTGEPLLPDLDIDVLGVRVDRLIFEPAITGERQVATIGGSIRSEERRVGKECVRTCRSRGWPDH